MYRDGVSQRWPELDGLRALAVVPVVAARAIAKQKPKAIMLGSAHVVIPAGKTRKLTLKLNAKARALLKRANVKARLTIVATGTDGTRATRVRTLTLKRKVVKRRR